MRTDSPLAPHERTLPAMLARQARAFGDRPFLSIAGAQWSHRDAADVAARRGAALRHAGVSRGDRVAVMCSNRVEFIETMLGCGWIGAAVVPINGASMGPQIEHVLKDSGARLLVIEEGFVDRLGTADLSRAQLQATWVCAVPGSPAGGAPGLGPASEAWPAPGDPIPAEDVHPGDTLAILYTSGTTGPSKGVLCSHAQYHWWGVNTASVLGLVEDDVLATTLPLFHINALNTCAQAATVGCRVNFLDKFSASGFWPAMRRCDATVVYLLGAMVPILLAQPASGAEREHRVRLGLGPGVPTAASDAFRARTGVALLEGYGSTETNFVIATAPDSPRTGVMGWLRPGFDARVVDDNDVELPAGEAGELVLRADEPFAFASGYFGLPDKTVEAWRNLWFHTGDRVVRDADGAFRFVDRIKDAIRRRGENISSWEVEQVLMSHAALAAAAVYPVQSWSPLRRCAPVPPRGSERLGSGPAALEELAEDEVMAAVILRPGMSLAAAELAQFCEARLPRFAIPRYIDLVAELPRTENGKVQKYKLRERGITPSAWDRTPPR